MAHGLFLLHLVTCLLSHPVSGEVCPIESVIHQEDAHMTGTAHIELLQHNFQERSSRDTGGAHKAQQKQDVEEWKSRVGQRDLVFMQQPNCHGHTVMMLAYENEGLLWGKLNPSLAVISNSTGCHMWYTPQKYWPEDLAHSYFGDKQIFGTLRDPYDRTANQFRYFVKWPKSEFPAHYQEYFRTCNVNAFLEEELPKVVADPYKNDCQWQPMSEYFDMPYGITVAFDNRKIPWSLNELLREHGYGFLEGNGEALHNIVCDNIWAGSLNNNVKAMIREIYARDFDLLCNLWGYCDPNELTCHSQFDKMCGDAPSFIKDRPFG